MLTLDNEKGIAALIGLLLVILVIAVLTYGGSFFSNKSQVETYVEVDRQAERMINDIELNNIKRQAEINQLEN